MTGHADTEELNDEVRETFTHHNRTYQRYAIDRRIYCVPVDEVCNRMSPFSELDPQTDLNAPIAQSLFAVGQTRKAAAARALEWQDDGFGELDGGSKHAQGILFWYSKAASWLTGNFFQVIGIDVSPHHYNPEESVDNLYLNIDNLNMPLQFHSNHFDLVNSRLVAGGIDRNRWHGYMRDILRCLRGGGWCQMVEMDFNAQSDNGTLTDGHALRQWSEKYTRAASQYKSPEAPRRLGHWMRHAGFTDVEERNQRDFDIGAANQENVRLLLGSLALYPFTELLNMAITEFHVLVAQARAEASNAALKVRSPRLPFRL
ncbi:S-adenosyl-L-methionine-dependent methyltransferase [Hypoxylon sp. NC1633]|nr:S-adenosyl-L-methionine-dependent methyltransferase [Hypoxylon sp. NC1633]